MSLTEARHCYETASRLKAVADVIAETQRGVRLLDGISGPEADTLRLALLDLELQAQSGETYLPPSPATVEQFARLSQQANLPLFRARAQHYQGLVTWSGRSFAAGLEAMRTAVSALEACGDTEGRFHAITSLGLFTSVMGNLNGGIGLMRESLTLYEQLIPAVRESPIFQGNRARLMMRMALNLFDLDYFEEALDWLRQARDIFEALGRGYGCTTEYAQLYSRVGCWQEAERWATMGMQNGPQEADRAYARTIYGFVLGQQERYPEAVAQLEQALETVTRLGLERWQRALASVYLADLLLAPGDCYDPERAEALSDQGLEIGESSAVHYGSIYGLLNKARLALQRGDHDHAVEMAVEAANRVRARQTLTLVREEEVLWWEFVALDAAGRDGSASLADAYQRLQTAASRISDPAMRRSFLNEVPLHREIIARYVAHSNGSHH